MCLTCACLEPANSHGDERNITFDDLQAAADASGITPEQAAANIVMTLAFADGDDTDDVAKSAAAIDTIAVNVLKAQEERRFTLGLAYPALKADANTAADGHRDFVSPSVLEAAAWAWAAKSRDIGLYHADGVSNQATVVESYIWRAEPWVVKAADGSSVTISPGDWLVGCIWSEEAWPLVKSGAIRGFSPQGAARRRRPTDDDLQKLRS